MSSAGGNVATKINSRGFLGRTWRAARYPLIYFLIMVVALLIPVWHEADWEILGFFYRTTDKPDFSKDIEIIDVPYRVIESRYRQAVGSLLDYLARLDSEPKGVILDIWIANDKRGLKYLKDGIRNLTKEHVQYSKGGTSNITKQNVPVYAAINPWRENSQEVDEGFMRWHAQDIYYNLLDGYGHTVIDYPSFYDTVLKYDPLLTVGAIQVPALVYEAYEDVNHKSPEPLAQARQPKIIQMGRHADAMRHTATFISEGSDPASGRFVHYCADGSGAPFNKQHPLDLSGKYLIVGSLNRDKENIAKRPGPELIGWALTSAVENGGENAKSIKVTDSPWLHLTTILAFPTLAFLIFSLLSQQLRHSRLRLSLAALGSVLTAVVLLALIDYWVIFKVFKTVYPQLSLATVGILVATGVAVAREKQILALQAYETDLAERKEAEANVYDVFISYSRAGENLQWVERHIYEPLSNTRKSDGPQLRIFFDRKSIMTGTSWYPKLAQAIHGSRFFLPVYSSDYFKKPFCRFEMERAAIKRVGQKDFILALARDTVEIPQEYNHIQFADASVDPEFMEHIVRQIREVS